MQELKHQIEKVVSGESDTNKKVAHRTVFHEMLNSNLPPQELSLDRLHHEAGSITGAGIDTTKTMLSMASFHIVSNPRIYKRLHQELLVKSIPNPSAKPPTLSELEQLPYLNAVQEGKRGFEPSLSLTT